MPLTSRSDEKSAATGACSAAAGAERLNGAGTEMPGGQLLAAIREQLSALADPSYAKFQSALLRKSGEETLTGSAAHYLGVRLPELRKMAKQLAKEDWHGNLEALRAGSQGWGPDAHNAGGQNTAEISDSLYEELMLEGILIGLAEKQSGSQFALVADFVPKIDNWGLCDSFCTGLKFVKSCEPECWEFLQRYLRSDREYEIRFGVVMLLIYFIKEEYIDRLYPVFDAIRHDGYYVKMAVAWAVSICYVKFPEKTLAYLKSCGLDDFTYNKALQKITESRCVSAEEKMMIRGMKRK